MATDCCSNYSPRDVLAYDLGDGRETGDGIGASGLHGFQGDSYMSFDDFQRRNGKAGSVTAEDLFGVLLKQTPGCSTSAVHAILNQFDMHDLSDTTSGQLHGCGLFTGYPRTLAGFMAALDGTKRINKVAFISKIADIKRLEKSQQRIGDKLANMIWKIFAESF